MAAAQTLQTLADYVAWYDGSAYAENERGRKVSADAKLAMIEAQHPPGMIYEPAFDGLVLAVDRTGGANCSLDYGAGRFRQRSQPGLFYLPIPGEALISESYDMHDVRSFVFAPDTVSAMSHEILDREPVFGALHAKAWRNDLLLNLTDHLWQIGASESCSSRLFAESVTGVIVSVLGRSDETNATIVRGTLAPWQLRRAIDYLREHLTEDVSLSDLAAECGLSPFHFSRAFKRSTGMPPHRYQIKLRLERARELLGRDGLSIADIAEMIGGYSPQSIARLFRRELGITPTEYRLLHR